MLLTPSVDCRVCRIGVEPSLSLGLPPTLVRPTDNRPGPGSTGGQATCPRQPGAARQTARIGADVQPAAFGRLLPLHKQHRRLQPKRSNGDRRSSNHTHITSSSRARNEKELPPRSHALTPTSSATHRDLRKRRRAKRQPGPWGVDRAAEPSSPPLWPRLAARGERGKQEQEEGGAHALPAARAAPPFAPCVVRRRRRR